MTIVEHDPLIIGGSHLQALIYAVSGLVIAIVWRDELLGWPIFAAAALAGVAVAVAFRRCTLHADRIVYRRIGKTISAPVGSFSAVLGHRYLSVSTHEGSSFKLEVPVEIRPDVRDWVAAKSTPSTPPA